MSSVLDLNAARIRAEFSNRGEVPFMRRVVDRFRRAELGLDDRHADVWMREVYEQFGASHRRIPVRMDFTLIERRWLREVVKEVTWVRMARQGVGPTSAYRTLMHVAHFERWAGQRLDRGPEAIDRRLLEDYLTHVRGLPYSAAEREHRLVSLDAMLSLARALEIESFSASACYLRGELAQRTGRRLPRFYDEHVAAQFDDPGNRARLTDPAARIGFLVMRHAGLRISSACSLKLDCLAVDPGGQPWLMYLDHKGDDEDLVPISTEIAEEIRAQQRRVRERFPARRGCCPPSEPTATGTSTCVTLRSAGGLAGWVLECDIREQSGRPIEFKPHRFRHTIATELINRGMSKTGIQRFLSHDSGAMTDVYAHMLDQTLKQEWLATKERVNAAGERVALTTPLIDDDAAWLKHQLARAKQTLPDGECGLPIQQNCPHPNACHSCPHFLTDERYRPVLEEQLTRAEQRVADAERAGHERLAEINRPDVLDLRRIIAGLDRLGAMSRPQPEPLAAFQRQRSAERRNAVIAAIRKLDRAGEPITVAAVAGLAGVDRSYIYDQRRPARGDPPTTSDAGQAGAAPGSRAGDDRVAAGTTDQRPRGDRTAQSREPQAPRALAVALGDAWRAESELPRAAG